MNELGIYIHIPFCHRKCAYCDFVSFCMSEDVQKNYLSSLLSEIDLVADKFSDRVVDTIFIGGGTPSVVFDGFISTLSKKIASSFRLSEDLEFTIEANPDSLTLEKVHEYVSAGINRVSIGVQSVDSSVLKSVQRQQTIDEVDRAIRMLREAGISNINCDMILGLPNSNIENVRATVNYFIANKIPHVSMYSLQLEECTPLGKRVVAGEEFIPSEDTVIKQYEVAYARMTEAGLIRYEISNFALPDYECKHNIKYWTGKDYLGLGLASHSYLDGVRSWNTTDLTKYMQKISNHEIAREGSETLTSQQLKEEAIMLSLRTRYGLDLAEYEKRFNEDILVSKSDTIEKLEALNMIKIENGYLCIENDYFNVSNSIILELID